jgi:hypothetical protein
VPAYSRLEGDYRAQQSECDSIMVSACTSSELLTHVPNVRTYSRPAHHLHETADLDAPGGEDWRAPKCGDFATTSHTEP